MWVKCLATFVIGETNTPYFDECKWHILCMKESQDEYKYNSITEKHLEECVQANLVFNWKIDINALFNNEYATGLIDPQHLMDMNDPDLPPADNKFGLLSVCYSYYIKTCHMSIYSGNTTGTVSGVRYEGRDNTYFGMVQYPSGETEIEELTAEWVNQNFEECFLQALKTSFLEGKKKFINVPPGDVRHVRECFIKIDNPIVFYPQHQSNTCVFSAMASVLHYSGYFVNAKFVDNLREQFYGSERYAQELEFVMKRLIKELIANCSQFMVRRRIRQLNKNFD
jgi:hypothetical protein